MRAKTWVDMNLQDRLVLFIAEGFGSGRLKPGPGTWGTLVGLGWHALLIWLLPVWLWAVAVLATTWLAVPVCARAEKILGKEDPGSVVLDEIVAVPWCFAGAVLFGAVPLPAMPWVLWAAVFVGFRFFDIVKPPPIRQLQDFPGGWGVVVDDVAAGIATAALISLVSVIG